MQKTKLPNLITILVITLITILMWVGFSIYRAFTTNPEPAVPQDVSATLNPSLDTDTINKVESGLFFSASQIPQINFSATPTPAASIVPIQTPIATPVASASATPTGTPTPTP